MKKQTKTKEEINIKKDIYNIYATLMTMFISAIGGFGMFWFYQLFGVFNVFVNMFVGMMVSAGFYNVIKQMYPIKK